MLGPNFKEGIEGKITLKSVDGPTLKAIIQYIYFGHIELNGNNVESILTAASSMEIVPLEEKCGIYLHANLTKENCLNALMLADRYGFGQCKADALKMVCVHFGNIPKADIWQIDGDIFKELLKCEHFDVPESTIFECLVEWARQSESDRTKCMPELLKSIRLECMTGEVISKMSLNYFVASTSP